MPIALLCVAMPAAALAELPIAHDLLAPWPVSEIAQPSSLIPPSSILTESFGVTVGESPNDKYACYSTTGFLQFADDAAIAVSGQRTPLGRLSKASCDDEGETSDSEAASAPLPAAAEDLSAIETRRFVEPTSAAPDEAPDPGFDDAIAEATAPATRIATRAVAPPMRPDATPWIWLLVAAIAALPIVSLYRKLRRDALLVQSTRHAVLSYIRDKPGAAAGTVARALEIDRSTANHHLRVLVEFGVVEARRIGGWVRYFPPGRAASDFERCLAVALDSDAARLIYAAKQAAPAAGPTQIARSTNLDRTTVLVQLARFRRFGILSTDNGPAADHSELRQHIQNP